MCLSKNKNRVTMRAFMVLPMESMVYQILFKVLPMVPLVIPLVPMVPLVKTVGSQYCRQSTAKLPTLESHRIQYGVLNFKLINFTNEHCFYQYDISK